MSSIDEVTVKLADLNLAELALRHCATCPQLPSVVEPRLHAHDASAHLAAARYSTAVAATRSAADPEPALLYRLWSGKHGMWWRGNAYGYTADADAAGLFTEADALRYVRNSALSGDPEQVTRMVAVGRLVPDPDPDIDTSEYRPACDDVDTIHIGVNPREGVVLYCTRADEPVWRVPISESDSLPTVIERARRHVREVHQFFAGRVMGDDEQWDDDASADDVAAPTTQLVAVGRALTDVLGAWFRTVHAGLKSVVGTAIEWEATLVEGVKLGLPHDDVDKIIYECRAESMLNWDDVRAVVRKHALARRNDGDDKLAAVVRWCAEHNEVCDVCEALAEMIDDD